MASVKRLLMITFALALFCALPARADETYSYTGNTLNQGGCVGPCFLSVTFTIATPFGDLLNDVGAVPESLSFSDNAIPNDVITSSDATSLDVTVWTNASGAITQWDLSAEIHHGNIITFIETDSIPGHISDSSWQCENGNGLCNSYVYDYYNINDSGNALVGTYTPEPSSLLLFASGLCGVLGAARRMLLN
jgi:PEP-CTERM motif